MRVPPASMTFTLLLSFLVALPSFGIDMNLPALTAKGAALHVTPAQAGLMMSLFMLGFAVAPLFYGPASDRYGRKPRRGVRLHALYHRRDRLRICSVAADASDMARRPGCWRWREHDDCLGHYPLSVRGSGRPHEAFLCGHRDNDAAGSRHLTSGPWHLRLRLDRAECDAGGDAALAVDCRRRRRRDRLRSDGG